MFNLDLKKIIKIAVMSIYVCKVMIQGPIPDIAKFAFLGQ